MTRTPTLRRLPGYLFLAISAIVSVFPLYFMLVSATNTSADVLSSRLLPGAALVDNFNALVAAQDVGAAMYNSVVNAVVTTVLALQSLNGGTAPGKYGTGPGATAGTGPQ